MKKITSTATGLAAFISLLMGGLAHADSTGSPSQTFLPLGKSSTPNNYLGVSVGTTKSDGFCTGVQNCKSADTNWKAYAGVKVTDSIMAEGGYVKFGQQQGQDANGAAVSQKAGAFTLAGVLQHSVSDQLAVFGKAGAARWSADQTDSTGTSSNKGTGLLVGAGASYDLGKNMGIRAEWERYNKVGSTATTPGGVDLLSVGVTFSSL